MLTEIIDLPSKGNLYPEDHPLSSGKIEIKHMTAREEDILTTKSFIESGVVTDKLVENVIVSDEIDPLDLSVGDKEKILLQTRILGYGSDYTFKLKDGDNVREVNVDLSDIEDKGRPDLFENSPFVEFNLESTGKKVVLKIQNGHDVKRLQEEIKSLQNSGSPVGIVSLRLAYLIHSIEGDTDEAKIREFARNMPARDSMALRTFVDVITPDVDLTTMVGGEEVEIPMGINFFYPSA